MRMNRWLWPGRCVGILLTLMIMTLNPIRATAARDHAPKQGRVGADSGVSAVQPVAVLPVGHSVGVDAVAFAPNGTLIASGNVDNLGRLWQTQTGKLWRTWLWDVQTGTVLHTLANLGGAEKSPEAAPSYRQPGGPDRALRGSVIAGIPQT